MGVPSSFGEGQALYSLTYQNTAMRTLFTLHNILIRDTLKVLLWIPCSFAAGYLEGHEGHVANAFAKMSTSIPI